MLSKRRIVVQQFYIHLTVEHMIGIEGFPHDCSHQSAAATDKRLYADWRCVIDPWPQSREDKM